MPEKKALSQKNNLDIQRTLQPLPRYLKRLTNGNGQRILKGLIFDVIDHSLLLQKLKANGISGAEHAWFFSYLTNRKQFVQCNRVNSNVDSRLNWEPHISQLIERVSPKTALLNRFAGFLDTLNIPQSKTSSGRKTFQIIAGASDWNSLPTELRKRTSI